MVLDVASSYEDVLGVLFSAPIAAKAWLATFAVVLVVVQALTAARMWGRIQGVVRLPVETVQRIHRWSGRLAVLLSLPVAFHCIFILGFQTGTTRAAVHSVVGSFVYGVLAAKLLVLKRHEHPPWVLPLAGGALVTVFAVLWATSSWWYFTEVRFGF